MGHIFISCTRITLISLKGKLLEKQVTVLSLHQLCKKIIFLPFNFTLKNPANKVYDYLITFANYVSNTCN